MALIKCPECGKEISDKASACINCGCPVSEMKPQKPASQNKDPISLEMFSEYFGGTLRTVPANQAPQAPKKPQTRRVTQTPQAPQTPKSPIKPVPKEMPDVVGISSRLIPGIVMKIIAKIGGFCLLGGAAALIMGIVDGVRYGTTMDPEVLCACAAAIVGGILLAKLYDTVHLLEVRGFLNKEGYADSVKNDVPPYNNCVRAYNLCPGKLMLRYVRKRNPDGARRIESDLAKRKQEKKK